MLSLRLVAAACAVLCLALPAAAAAGKPPKTSAAAGYDISYPQCGGSFPTKVLFGIVGVNNGIVYSSNPCLGAGSGASELAWAEQYEQPAILYANTGNPSPALSSHWPTGQTFPQYCDPAQTDSAACSYDYGWNAAADGYRRAVDAYVSLGRLPAGATSTPQPNEWWLDVETANSWQQDTAHNVAALQGEADYLAGKGAATVGFYANGGDWQTITGGTAAFSAHPSWRAGAGSRANAQSYCGTRGFTGGALTYSQYASSGFDADVRC